CRGTVDMHQSPLVYKGKAATPTPCSSLSARQRHNAFHNPTPAIQGSFSVYRSVHHKEFDISFSVHVQLYTPSSVHHSVHTDYRQSLQSDLVSVGIVPIDRKNQSSS